VNGDKKESILGGAGLGLMNKIDIPVVKKIK